MTLAAPNPSDLALVTSYRAQDNFWHSSCVHAAGRTLFKFTEGKLAAITEYLGGKENLLEMLVEIEMAIEQHFVTFNSSPKTVILLMSQSSSFPEMKIDGKLYVVYTINRFSPAIYFYFNHEKNDVYKVSAGFTSELDIDAK
jgi:hypothetical protein